MEYPKPFPTPVSGSVFKSPALSLGRFLLDAWHVLSSRPWLLFFSVGSQIAFNSLEPSMALIIKRVTGAFEKGPENLTEAILHQTPLFLTLVAVLSLLRLLCNWSKGVFDSAIVLALQRKYLERRLHINPQEDVSRMMFDCLEAKRALDPFHFDLWRNGPRLVSVLTWQYSLAPVWLPLLLVVTAPHLLSILLFTPLQQHARKVMLRANSRVARCSQTSLPRLQKRQQRLLGRWAWLHFWTGCMNAFMEWAGWPTLVLILLGSQYFNLGLVPTPIRLSDLAVFTFNMSLIGLPIRELGMIYTKIRGHWPAVIRVLYPVKPSADTSGQAQNQTERINRVSSPPCRVW